MALSSFSGMFTATTSGTSQPITGLGFQPKAIVFFANNKTAQALLTTVTGGQCFGFSDGTNHTYVAVSGDDNVATSNCGKARSTTQCIGILTDGTPTVGVEAKIASFDSGGFTLTWSGTPAAAYEIGYWAVGGDDILNVKVGSSTLPTVTGNSGFTGVGFKPDVVFFSSSSMTTTGTATDVQMSVGVAVDANRRWAFECSAADNQTLVANYNAKGSHWNTKCLSGQTVGSASAIEFSADLTSMDSDGFTLNIVTAPATAYDFGYMAIQGGQWDAGDFSKITTTGNQAIATAFQGSSLFIFSGAQTTSAGVLGTTIHMIGGGATSTTARAVAGVRFDNTINARTRLGATASDCCDVLVGSGIAADFVSFDSTPQFTINWATADANAVKLGYLVAASNPLFPATEMDSDNQVRNYLQPPTELLEEWTNKVLLPVVQGGKDMAPPYGYELEEYQAHSVLGGRLPDTYIGAKQLEELSNWTQFVILPVRIGSTRGIAPPFDAGQEEYQLPQIPRFGADDEDDRTLRILLPPTFPKEDDLQVLSSLGFSRDDESDNPMLVILPPFDPTIVPQAEQTDVPTPGAMGDDSSDNTVLIFLPNLPPLEDDLQILSQIGFQSDDESDNTLLIFLPPLPLAEDDRQIASPSPFGNDHGDDNVELIFLPPFDPTQLPQAEQMDIPMRINICDDGSDNTIQIFLPFVPWTEDNSLQQAQAQLTNWIQASDIQGEEVWLIIPFQAGPPVSGRSARMGFAIVRFR